MQRYFRRSVRLLAALGVIALFTLAGSRTISAADTAGGAYILTGSNQLARVLSGDGTLVSAAVTVAGIAAGEELVAIGTRPQNNRLYGLASNGAGAVRLYHIDSGSGSPVATPLSAAPVQFDDGVAPVAITGSAFDISFNPTVDRVRVVSTTGLNFRMNPNTGALVDGNTTTPGINPDGALNGGAPRADASAYTNSVVNAAATTQYTLDSGSDMLFIQNPPNNGTLTNGVPVTLQGAPLDFSDAAFDIPSSVAVTAANSPAAGVAFAVLTVNNNDDLYTLNLTTGAATRTGSLGDLRVLDIALAPAVPVGMVLSADATGIQRFRLNDPTALVSVAITGVQATEKLVGFDGRPATGQLIAVGVDDAANTATLYVLDSQTGAATALGTPGSIAYVDASGVPVDLPLVASGYGVDFNPTVDRVRVVTSSGLNLRMNPVNGTAVDGDAAAAGTNPDGAINGAATGLTATAYTNSFAGTTVTTQYGLDATSDGLFLQNPPNVGTQTKIGTITAAGAAIDFSAVNGFDIPTNVVASASNTPVTSGVAYAVLTVGNSTALHTIDLTNGNATPVGTLGTGAAGASGLAVWTPSNVAVRYLIALPLVQR